MLEGTAYEAQLDKARLLKIKDHFETIRPRYKAFLLNINEASIRRFSTARFPAA